MEGIMKEIYKKALVTVLFTVFVAALLIVLIPKIWIYFLPFLIAWLIAACACPIVHFLEKKIRLKRKMGSVLVIIAVIAGIVLLFYGLIATLLHQLLGWMESLPDLMEQISDVMQALTGQLAQWGILEDANLSNITEKFGNQIVSAISGLADGGSKVAFSAVSGLTKQVPMVMIGLFVCLISSYFFVAEKNENEAFLKQVIPESIQKNFKVLTGSSKKAVGGYIRAQVKIELWIYLVLVIGLFILRVDYVLVVSFIIAFLDFLPILGAGIVMIPWAVIAFLCADYRRAVGLLIVWGATQLLRQVIQPKYVGESIGIRPLPTLILLYFGYCIAGMAGLILAIPVGYVLLNLYQAGLFDTPIESVKILIRGFNDYRKIDQGEKKENEKDN